MRLVRQGTLLRKCRRSIAPIDSVSGYCFFFDSFQFHTNNIHLARVGQFRPIRAVRFIAEGTVDERILQLQEKKRLVFDGTVGR